MASVIARNRREIDPLARPLDRGDLGYGLTPARDAHKVPARGSRDEFA